MAITLLLISLAVFPALGLAYTARRLPRGVTWAIIVLAAGLLSAFVISMLAAHDMSEADGKGYVMAMLLVVMPLSIIGTPICIGLIVGAMLGLNRY
jgi:hypothetical protein